MGNNPEISNAIRQGEFFRVPELIEKNRDQNMCTMQESLNRLKEDKIISDEEWMNRISLIPNRHKDLSDDN